MPVSSLRSVPCRKISLAVGTNCKRIARIVTDAGLDIESCIQSPRQACYRWLIQPCTNGVLAQSTFPSDLESLFVSHTLNAIAQIAMIHHPELSRGFISKGPRCARQQCGHPNKCHSRSNPKRSAPFPSATTPKLALCHF